MTIGKNTTVTIDYSLYDDGGNFLEDTKESGAVVYLHGTGFLLPPLEEALSGKSEGDEVTVPLTVGEAYGDRDESLVFQVPREDFENPEFIQIGEQVRVHHGTGGGIMRVTAVEDERITLDGNHPLAGKGLVFSFTIRGVRRTSQEDIDATKYQHEYCGGHGSAGGHCRSKEKRHHRDGSHGSCHCGRFGN